jgi:hypothetical protein
MPGMNLKKKKMKLKMRPAHVWGEDITTGTVAAIEDVAERCSPLGLSIELAAMEAAEEKVDDSDAETDVASSVEFDERLNAIIACRSRCYSGHILASKKSTIPRGRLGRLILHSSRIALCGTTRR